MRKDEVPQIGVPMPKILESIRQAQDFTVCGVVMLQKPMADAMCDAIELLDQYPGYINVQALNEWTQRKSKVCAKLREIATRKPGDANG